MVFYNYSLSYSCFVFSRVLRSILWCLGHTKQKYYENFRTERSFMAACSCTSFPKGPSCVYEWCWGTHSSAVLVIKFRCCSLSAAQTLLFGVEKFFCHNVWWTCLLLYPRRIVVSKWCLAVWLFLWDSICHVSVRKWTSREMSLSSKISEWKRKFRRKMRREIH